ncbi:hypothetical protein VHUM_00507 [Vanrija humicola]|uniref:Yeast cell wall synthesis Kre9/Knh1-like N-terminal domain-containing protein n=1 Tax=Vanrija humicola TaxID=5417 RepID=A0A7D8Z884_VANHU|nr:hypothetical protein VHUM_00507 [Vanrija humicola]
MVAVSALFATLVALASTARAGVYITSPTASSIVQAGETINVAWQDDGAGAKLADIGPSSIDIAVGSQLTQVVVQNLAEDVDVSKAQTVTATIDPTIGEDGQYYFVRVTSNSLRNGTLPYQSFSARFTIRNTNGTWTAQQAGLVNQSTSAVGPSGTASASRTSALPSGSASAASSSGSAAAGSASASSASASASAVSHASGASASAASASASASNKPSGAEQLLAPAGLAVAAGIAGWIAL